MKTSATTSEGQGRRREAGSEGSPEQTHEPTNRNVVRGPVPGATQHRMEKPIDPRDRVNGAVVWGKFTSLSGEICRRGGSVSATGAGLRPHSKEWESPPDPTATATGVGLRPTLKSVEPPPNPKAGPISALLRDGHRKRAEVSIGHSSRALRNWGDMTKDRTLWNKEEPWGTRST